MPFEELSHTADVSLRVWAKDLPGLFQDSAMGMYSLAGIKLAEKPRIQRIFDATGIDTEGLLVSFLSELIYYTEQHRQAFNHFVIQVQGRTLNVEMDGAPLVSIYKTIKAVTYHNLQIHQTARGYEVEIVFDV